jgi:imidazole glycerol-phosphate synthase subunit HisF
VVSIDARRAAGGYEVYTRAGTAAAGTDPVSLARRAERLGAGEILLTSIDQDGTLAGYDIELTRRVSSAVSIPVIASGGAGMYAHLVEAVREGGASAVAAASMYHFTQQTPLEAKRYMGERGLRVRL